MVRNVNFLIYLMEEVHILYKDCIWYVELSNVSADQYDTGVKGQGLIDMLPGFVFCNFIFFYLILTENVYFSHTNFFRCVGDTTNPAFEKNVIENRTS